jgi:hypothetical protein
MHADEGSSPLDRLHEPLTARRHAMIESKVEPKAYVKILLDETGELVGVEKDGKYYLPTEFPTDKVPPLVKENWSMKTMTVWHNVPCCVKSGGQLVCWPPCI